MSDHDRAAPPPARDVLGSAPAPVAPVAPEPPAPSRRFTMDGEEWIAQVSGQCAYGTGAGATAPLLAIDFATAARPEQPVRRALLPRGRFFSLYDEELRRLFADAAAVDAGSD